MDSGNIYLRNGSTFSIGSATATNNGDKFKVSGLELSDASLTLNSLTVNGATFNSNDGVVSFTDKNGGTLDIAAGQLIFGDGETEATMQVSNNQVIFTDQDGNLLDVGDPISTTLTMPLEVYDSDTVKFSVSTSGGITILNTTDDAFEMNKSLYLNGMLNIKDKFVVDSDFRLHATEDARFDGELLATNYVATSNLELGDMTGDTFNPRAELKTIEEDGKYRLQVEGDINEVLLDNKKLTIDNTNKFEFADEFKITNNNDLIAEIDTDGWISCGKQLTLGDGASDPAVKFEAEEDNYSLKITDSHNKGISIEGNMTIGSSNLDADLTVKGSATIESDLTVNGDINTNAVTMDGNLMLNGSSSIQFDSGEIHRDNNTDTIKMDSCKVWMENGARIDEVLEVNGNASLEVYSNTTTNSKMNINVHDVSDLQDNHSIPVIYINDVDSSNAMASCDVIKNSSEGYTADKYFRIYGESAGLILESDNNNIILESNTAINSDLTIKGDTTIGSSINNAGLTVNGSVYADHIESNGTVNVNGDAQFDQKLTINGNLVSNNTSSLTFKSTGEEDIVVNYTWLKNILDRLSTLEQANASI